MGSTLSTDIMDKANGRNNSHSLENRSCTLLSKSNIL